MNEYDSRGNLTLARPERRTSENDHSAELYAYDADGRKTKTWMVGGRIQ